MKILLSADFHSDFSRLNPLAKKVDLCICCGDIFDYHRIPEVKYKFPLPFFSIKGNKELWGGNNLYKTLEEHDNFYWMNQNLDRLTEMTGLRFYGINYRNEPTSIPYDIDILVSHQPAFGLADKCTDSYHAKMVPHCGSKSLRKIIDLFRPIYIISGHVHLYQRESTENTSAITLPPALIDPVLILKIEKSNPGGINFFSISRYVS